MTTEEQLSEALQTIRAYMKDEASEQQRVAAMKVLSAYNRQRADAANPAKAAVARRRLDAELKQLLED